MDYIIDHSESLFKLIVYSISIYLIFIKESITTNVVGWIILISHLYKDIICLCKWPIWCELLGIILALILIISGIQICNYLIVSICLFKLLSHIRQYLIQDKCYYGLKAFLIKIRSSYR